MSMTPEERARRKRMRTFQDEMNESDYGRSIIKYMLWAFVLIVVFITVANTGK